MKPHLNLLLVISFLISNILWGTSIEGINFPDTEKLQETTLKLNGVGVRKATIFKVKVYAAALYLIEVEHEQSKVNQLKNPKLLVMKFMREVPKDKINEAWDKAFEEMGKTFQSQLTALKNLMPDAKEGDIFEYVFWDDRTEFKLNQKLKGTLPGGAWGKALLNTWIGSKPPTEELKSGLLGLKE